MYNYVRVKSPKGTSATNVEFPDIVKMIEAIEQFPREAIEYVQLSITTSLDGVSFIVADHWSRTRPANCKDWFHDDNPGELAIEDMSFQYYDYAIWDAAKQEIVIFLRWYR